jgi:hypothetical protein
MHQQLGALPGVYFARRSCSAQQALGSSSLTKRLAASSSRWYPNCAHVLFGPSAVQRPAEIGNCLSYKQAHHTGRDVAFLLPTLVASLLVF